jgi:hypothetical protein
MPAHIPDGLSLTIPDVLGAVLSCILLLTGVVVAMVGRRRQALWWSVVIGAVIGGALAQIKYPDGACSWAVGWPFAVTRVQTACGDVWLTHGPRVLARVGDITASIAASLLVFALWNHLSRGGRLAASQAPAQRATRNEHL